VWSVAMVLLTYWSHSTNRHNAGCRGAGPGDVGDAMNRPAQTVMAGVLCAVEWAGDNRVTTRGNTMSRRQTAWWFWAVGSTLIALSWFHVVSYEIGWFGFVIGMIGSVMGWGVMPPPSEDNSPPTPQSPDVDAELKGE
jgi:hypothetical protein